jgi:hypothetical protein
MKANGKKMLLVDLAVIFGSRERAIIKQSKLSTKESGNLVKEMDLEHFTIITDAD